MKYIVSSVLRPSPHSFYGDSWERGPSPWHKDAFPSELAHAAPEQGKRAEGWFLIDGAGNAIGFVPDGEVVEIDVRVVKNLPADLRDELMRQGAHVVSTTGGVT